jgi:hypothetical protein
VNYSIVNVVNAQPESDNQNPVATSLQANTPAPSTVNVQVMQGNPIIVAWLLLDCEGSDRCAGANNAEPSVYTTMVSNHKEQQQ